MQVYYLINLAREGEILKKPDMVFNVLMLDKLVFNVFNVLMLDKSGI